MLSKPTCRFQLADYVNRRVMASSLTHSWCSLRAWCVESVFPFLFNRNSVNSYSLLSAYKLHLIERVNCVYGFCHLVSFLFDCLFSNRVYFDPFPHLISMQLPFSVSETNDQINILFQLEYVDEDTLLSVSFPSSLCLIEHDSDRWIVIRQELMSML